MSMVLLKIIYANIKKLIDLFYNFLLEKKMNPLNIWKIILVVISLFVAFIAFRLKVPPAMISFAVVSAYIGTALFSFVAFLLLPKSKRGVAAKVLIIIGLGFLVHRFMNDVDQKIRNNQPL